MRLLISTTIILVMPHCVLAQTYTIGTIAGNGAPGSSGDNGTATNAELNYPRGVAVDAGGTLYIADYLNHRVRKVSNGVITTVAGGGAGGDGGPATGARLVLPMGVAVDPAGNLYIADTGNHTVRKVTDGIITTVAGNGTIGFNGEGDNGPATSAQLNLPRAIAVDSAGNLYIGDFGARRVRKVSNGIITTVAGGGAIQSNSDNMPATSAYMPAPNGVAVDSAGSLYVANTIPAGVYKISNGALTSIAWNGLAPQGIAVDSSGGLYVSDQFGFVFRIADERIATIAGNAQGSGFGGDGGPATSALLSEPSGIAVDSAGRVYVADTSNHRIRVLVPSGPAPVPAISAITNAASNLAGDISPGEIIVLYGSGLGPGQLVKAAPGLDGSFGTQCGDTRVFVNGTAAPIIYASAAQTSAVVPYGITGRPQVAVSYRGEMSAGVSVWTIASAPGIFTYDSSGRGPAAAINQDGITVNTSASPTHIGDIISIYATGEGETTPAGVDGKPASAPYPYPKLHVTATVGGQAAPVTYAGGAPGTVAGLMQVNLQIPAGIQTGNDVPVVLRVGEARSQDGVTIAVR
jgi:uncharacterized protein (TIGR03437 family)